MGLIRRARTRGVGTGYLGSLEKFVARGNPCIEPMDSSPYARVVGRRLLQKSAHGNFNSIHRRERWSDEG